MAEDGIIKVVRVREYTGKKTSERVWYVAIDSDEQALDALRTAIATEATSDMAVVGELQPAMRGALAMRPGDIKPADSVG